MDNSSIAQAFTEMGDMLEITGGNPFKVRAYRQAAQVIDTYPLPVANVPPEELLKLPGIGAHMAARIAELLKTGHCAEHDRLAATVPPGVVEMLRLEGVGPRTAASIWKRLELTSIDAIDEACRDGSLEQLPRMGAARVKAIEEAIGRYRQRSTRLPLHRALAQAEPLLSLLRGIRGVLQAEAVGSVRRRRETVGDLDLLVASRVSDPVMTAFVHAPEVAEVLAEGSTRSAVRLKSGLHVDLRVVPPDVYGAALHYFTGSKTHSIALRTRAVRLGLKVSEYGVFDDKGRLLGGAREEDIFRAVGLPWIPPELREGTGEIEAAEQGRLPKLVEETDVVGDLHVHTDGSSDGQSTLAEMYAEATRLGRRYLAITDHSRSRPLGYDGPAALAAAESVRRFSREHPEGTRLLAGIEVDILEDGTLDLPLDVLAQLDWVVASIHSHLRDNRATVTRRLIKAMQSGVVDVIGHPSGRLLGTRDGYDFDLEQVLAVAAETGVAMEVNAQPERLDLTDLNCRVAGERGVRVAISSDAHAAAHLANLKFGIWVARRGWLTRNDVVNTSPTAPRRRASARPAAVKRPASRRAEAPAQHVAHHRPR